MNTPCEAPCPMEVRQARTEQRLENIECGISKLEIRSDKNEDNFKELTETIHKNHLELVNKISNENRHQDKKIATLSTSQFFLRLIGFMIAAPLVGYIIKFIWNK